MKKSQSSSQASAKFSRLRLASKQKTSTSSKDTETITRYFSKKRMRNDNEEDEKEEEEEKENDNEVENISKCISVQNKNTREASSFSKTNLNFNVNLTEQLLNINNDNGEDQTETNLLHISINNQIEDDFVCKEADLKWDLKVKNAVEQEKKRNNNKKGKRYSNNSNGGNKRTSRARQTILAASSNCNKNNERRKRSDEDEELQIALALSRSLYEQENGRCITSDDDDDEEESTKNCKKMNEKIEEDSRKRRKTLEQFGFSSRRPQMQVMNKRPEKVTTRKKNGSKFKYITPVLFTRTEEDRQQLIQTKINEILKDNVNKNENVTNEKELDLSQPIINVYSDYLQSLHDEEASIFNLNTLNETEFRVSSLNLPNEPKEKCGHLLKDWRKIAGRSPSPSPPSTPSKKHTNIKENQQEIDKDEHKVVNDESTIIDVSEEVIIKEKHEEMVIEKEVNDENTIIDVSEEVIIKEKHEEMVAEKEESVKDNENCFPKNMVENSSLNSSQLNEEVALITTLNEEVKLTSEQVRRRGEEVISPDLFASSDDENDIDEEKEHKNIKNQQLSTTVKSQETSINTDLITNNKEREPNKPNLDCNIEINEINSKQEEEKSVDEEKFKKAEAENEIFDLTQSTDDEDNADEEDLTQRILNKYSLQNKFSSNSINLDEVNNSENNCKLMHEKEVNHVNLQQIIKDNQEEIDASFAKQVEEEEDELNVTDYVHQLLSKERLSFLTNSWTCDEEINNVDKQQEKDKNHFHLKSNENELIVFESSNINKDDDKIDNEEREEINLCQDILEDNEDLNYSSVNINKDDEKTENEEKEEIILCQDILEDDEELNYSSVNINKDDENEESEEINLSQDILEDDEELNYSSIGAIFHSKSIIKKVNETFYGRKFKIWKSMEDEVEEIEKRDNHRKLDKDIEDNDFPSTFSNYLCSKKETGLVVLSSSSEEDEENVEKQCFDFIDDNLEEKRKEVKQPMFVSLSSSEDEEDKDKQKKRKSIAVDVKLSPEKLNLSINTNLLADDNLEERKKEVQQPMFVLLSSSEDEEDKDKQKEQRSIAVDFELTPEKVNLNTNTNLLLMEKRSTNVTPMPDYERMDSPSIHKELDKFGIKPLKRRRGIQMLEYIYESTHPLVKHCQNNLNLANMCNDDLYKYNVNDDQLDEEEMNRARKKARRDGGHKIEILGDKLLELEDPNKLIFERKQSAKIKSCRQPLEVAWHNFLCINPEIKENILFYEPLQLEVIHNMLKEHGHKYHIQDLLTFFDRKCITVRVNNKQ